MDIEKFRVLTLNCWGVFIPFVCKRKDERISAIGDKLSDGYYDIILLQEIWSDRDYEIIRSKLNEKYPYNHYFHSNAIGSGCCIFTKYKIVETFFHRFPLNGYPHYVWHGDWYGGKGVGLATLELSSKKFRVNVYVAHFHARYEHLEENDQYDFHRTSQGYEMGKFIKLTSNCCDAVIVGGDFNMDDSMLGFNLLVAGSGIKDTWKFGKNTPSLSIQDAATCDRPDGPYCDKKWNKWYPYGERLDYIFFRQNACIKLVCSDCSLVMRSVEGSKSFHYSDHCGVEANFEMSQNPLETSDEINQEYYAELCVKTLEKLDQELKRIKKNYKMNCLFLLMTLICIVFDYPNTLVTSLFDDLGVPSFLNRIILIVLSISSFIFLWYIVVSATNEKKAVLNMRQELRVTLERFDKIGKKIISGDTNSPLELVKEKVI